MTFEPYRGGAVVRHRGVQARLGATWRHLYKTQTSLFSNQENVLQLH